MDLAPSITFFLRGVRADRVKTLVQDDVQSENVTFFTARSPAVSWVNCLGTVLDGPMGDDQLICNANDRVDAPFWWRMIPCKKTRTTSAGLGQLPTRDEANFVEATATDGSD